MDLIPFGWDPFLSRVDVQETAQEVIVLADIPGVDPQKLNLEIGRDSVKLSGTVSQEHSVQSFLRVVRLPTEVISENAKAVAKNGRLRITLPKRHPQDFEMRKIPVEEE